MAENSTKPKIRFKGFSDDWEHRELDSEVEFYSGLTYSPADVIKNGGTFVLRSSNVKNGEIINADDVFVNSDVVNSANVKKGDVIVVVRNGSRSLIGKHAQIKEEMDNTVIGAFMTGIRAEQSSFINALLDTPQYNKEIEKNLGATINQITTGAFKKMKFIFPEPKEQRTLGDYFNSIDNLIKLHQRKYDKLVNIKKAMLEKMFPKNGSKVPEIRFKGFTEDWNLYKLQEVATMKARIGWQGLTQKEFLDEGDYYLITGTDFDKGIIDFKNCHFIGEDRYNQDINIQIKNDDVLITKDGTIGKVAYVENMDKPATLNAGVFVIRGKDKNICNLYLYHYLAAPFLLDYADKQATGGTIKHLNQNVLVNFPVPMPKIEEQQKIGAFFKDLDGLIALHQRKYDKLINIKKAMLEKMFV